jgi:predicted DsbA family dithiol-disulfide isomerase
LSHISQLQPFRIALAVLTTLASPRLAWSADPAPKTVIELFVMSQCPWGVKAENVVFPAVTSLAPHVQLQLRFIGETAPSADGDAAKTRFTAMHGDPEVQENIRQVCAAKHFPDRYMDYILARNANVNDPNWKDAATRAGLKADVVERCASGPEGAALMTENLKVHKERKATASPTIYIDGTLYSGARGLKSITLALCNALQAKGVKTPEACAKAEQMPADPVPTGSGCGAAAQAPAMAQGGCGGGGAVGGCGGCGGCGGAQAQPAAAVPRAVNDLTGIPAAPQAVELTVVVDPACPACRPAFLEPLRRLFPGAKVRTLDVTSKEGKQLIDRLKATRLPLYAFAPEVEQASNFAQAKRLLIKTGEHYVVRPEFARPTVRLDRPRAANHLDLFVNGLSATTPLAESELARFFTQTPSKDLTFSLHFVVQEAAREPEQHPSAPTDRVRAASIKELGSVTPGRLFAMGGEQELKESARQSCLFQHASMGDFFTYLSCRNQDLQNPRRAEQCLAVGPVIQQCMDGPESEQLLREDARSARALGINNGPAVLWENRYGPFTLDELGSLDELVTPPAR